MRSKVKTGALSALLIGTLVGTGGFLSAGAASAAIAPGSLTTTTSTSADVDRWVVPQTQQGGDYWTAERMQSAIPGEVLVQDNVAAGMIGAVAAGATSLVAPQQADPDQSPTATQVSPISHIGKIFFTLGGTDYVCSGNSISAANENTVVTAGHCVNEGPGNFASRLIFVPAYENGSAPFGQWNATELYAPTQWSNNGDISYDTGFAIVASPTGTSLSDSVGASGVTFNQSRGLTYTAYGYPAAPPFTGETLQSCYGTASADPYGQSQSQGIPCDMTGGSSGGPWMIGNGSSGLQNSVNSFGYNNIANTMFGPYWGSVIENTYVAASA
ncbi:hypothetical protein E3O21_15935 [Cryobacterium flavum]|nr:hypothetical protein E3O21_15935 [Cryobacterium flavum]TFD09797.1 hypothetical protein E3T35_14500 [Cryobacterium sp. TMT1-2-2]